MLKALKELIVALGQYLYAKWEYRNHEPKYGANEYCILCGKKH